MRFYSIQPSEIKRMSNLERMASYANIESIRSKEKIYDFLAASSSFDPKAATSFLLSAGALAFQYDEEALEKFGEMVGLAKNEADIGLRHIKNS